MKNIVLVITEPSNPRTSEKLRMGVGLTLDDGNRLSVLFIDDGLYTCSGRAAAPGVDVDKSLETLAMLNVDMLAHEPSALHRSLEPVRFSIRLITDEETAHLLKQSDITIT